MALLQAVVFPQEYLPCSTRCASCGYDVHAVAGELEVKRSGAVLQEEFVAMPHGGAWGTATCCSVYCTGRPVTSPSVADPGFHTEPAAVQAGKRRRRRKSWEAAKNREEAESQRQNHIAVERNRRRQMSEYLAVLRSLMPPSYAQRGDQASIVGGAINFVKELEQHLQWLQAQKRHGGHYPEPAAAFAGFFMYPQYSTAATDVVDVSERAPGTRPGVADIEVAVCEGHATVKVLVPSRAQKLPMLLLGLHRLGLAVLHLTVTTTADHMAFYTFSLRLGDGCQTSSAGDVAAAVHEMVADISIAEDRAC